MRKKSSKIRYTTILLMVCFLVVSCKKGIPKEVIPPDSMEKILYDYQIARSLSDKLPYEEREKTEQYMAYVFRKHHTTPEIFDSSLAWYSRHAEELNKIYSRVNERFKDELGQLNHLIALRDKKPVMTQPGDTADIWYGNRLVELTPETFANKIEFTIRADSNFKIQDRIEWKMRHTFLPLTQKRGNAVVALSIWFQNDSVLSKIRKIDRPGIISLEIKPDSAWAIKDIKGFIYYENRDKRENSSLLVDRISLIRYHKLSSDTLLDISPKEEVDTVKGQERDTVKESSMSSEPDVSKKSIQKEDSVNKQIRKSPKEMNRPRQGAVNK